MHSDSERLYDTLLNVLYERRKADARDVGAIDITKLAAELTITAKHAAVAAADLVNRRLVDGDGNMMGFVRISDGGMRYVDERRAASEAPTA